MFSILNSIELNLKKKESFWQFPEEKKTMTLTEIYEEGEHFCRALKELPVKKGDRVGIMLDNRSGYVPLLIGIWKCNAVAVPLRPKKGKYFNIYNYLGYVNENCQFKVLVVSDEIDPTVLERWNSIAEKAPAIKLSNLIHTVSSRPFHHTMPSIEPDDIAVIQYSSGSTGNPKGVIVTHRMMINQIKQINHEIRCNDNTIKSSASWMPFNHDMGLFIGILNPLYIGADNLLASPVYYMLKPSRWFTLMSNLKTDIHFTTNSAMLASARSLSRLDPVHLDFSRLYIYFAAEKVSPKVLETIYNILLPFNMTHYNFCIGYGMAENTLGASSTKTRKITISNFFMDHERKIIPTDDNNSHTFKVVSVGTPHENTEITIRDMYDNILPELTMGEINIEGPSVMPGYYNNTNDTKKALAGNRLRTNDLGFLYNKELYFYSRKDDLLIMGGRNIVPDDIEKSVEVLPFVRNTVLVGLDDLDNGNLNLILLAEYRKKPDNSLLEDHRREIQKKIFADFDLLIRNVRFCEKDDVEKTSSGKKRRKVIAKRLLEYSLKTF